VRSIVHEAALRYAELGYPVFPCSSGDKVPGTEHGFHDASTDPDQIDRWWTQRPSANVGIPTDGLLVVDVDAEATWLHGRLEWELDLAEGAFSRTPSGGRHFIFRQPDGKAWNSSQGQIAPHVDIRANGGYIVAPPSAIPGGKTYYWVPGNELAVPREQLSLPPEWLIEILDGQAPGATTTHSSPRVANTTTPGNPIPEGQRNGTLARLGGHMRRSGMTQAEIESALLRVNADRCVPPLGANEVQRVAASVARYEPDTISVALAENHWDQMMSGKKPEPFAFETITSPELNAADYRQEYLIENVMVRGQPMIVAGPRKSLKTNSCIDMALSLGSGGLFLGRFGVHKAVRVGMMSAESGPATIQETARRIAFTKGLNLDHLDTVVWSLQVPQLDNIQHVDALKRWVTGNALDVLILDPTYLMMLGIGQDAGNLFVVGRYLQVIADLVRDTGVTPILCHHLRKGMTEPYEPAELEDIAWAGFQEFTRQWLLLNRRSRYEPDKPGVHELWMNVGGSAGHSGQYGLDIEEGSISDPCGRRWSVEVITTGEAYSRRADAVEDREEERKQRKKESREEKQREAVLDALSEFPDGETSRTIRDTAGFGSTVTNRWLATLVEEGLVEECPIRKNKRNETGFRLKTPSTTA
jgi:hypothetical protein